MSILNKDFYNRDTIQIAKDLLGKKLVRRYKRRFIRDMIVETEAYLGFSDSASHAYKGKTRRNSAMFGPPGRAYVYFIYGMHYMLNIVTEEEDKPCAVLIRAIKPLEGLGQIEALRGKTGKDLTNGPAKLCQAMAIDISFNGWDVTRGQKLWQENHATIPETHICKGPRIGIDYAAPQDRKAEFRFLVRKDMINNP